MKILNIIIICLLLALVYITVAGNNTVSVDTIKSYNTQIEATTPTLAGTTTSTSNTVSKSYTASVRTEPDWCKVGTKITTSGSQYESFLTIKGMTTYQSREVCKAELVYNEGTIVQYFNVDSSFTATIIKDQNNNIIQEFNYIVPNPTSIPIPTPNPIPTVIVTPIPTPTPPVIYSYDNINIDHKIELCKPTPTVIYRQTGIAETDCGTTTFVLDNYPLDMLPSGGDSGIVSNSEMVLAKITVNGGISLIPWESVGVKMRWYDAGEYDANGNRLMYYTKQQTANSFNNEVTSFIGHFSWEIDEPGQYYVDVITEYGDARVVFDVI